MTRSEPVVVTRTVLADWPLPATEGDKASRGVVLVVGGSARTPGAVLLAAEAALRVGAGKLQVATVASMAPGLAVALPEALVLALPETPDGSIDPGGTDELASLVAEASCVVVGPGMTGHDETVALVRRLLREPPERLLLDAMALAAVTADPSCLHAAPGSVVTPNLDELATMLHADRGATGDAPGDAAADLADRSRAIVLAGGPESWTASPDGRRWRDPAGGSGLAASGSGDVLAGVVGGLLARGASPEQAAVWAASLHGRTGERLAATVGRVGFLARELLAELPRALAEVGH